MRISSSQIYMSGRQSMSAATEVEESLTIQKVDNPATPPQNQPQAQAQTQIKAPAVASYLGGSSSALQISRNDSSGDNLSLKDRLKVLVAEILLERATGKKVKLNPVQVDINPVKGNPAQSPVQSAIQGLQTAASGFSIQYNMSETYKETQSMSFSSQGIVKTADGKEIEISLNLNLSRSFVQTHNINIQMGQAQTVDPLVINFSGGSANLTETKFDFDLDSDGKTDKISFTGPNSGFLALDINGNGKIDNGKELFGPSTGNGFAELAIYDEDGNGWIDEADSIFDKLHIWTKDANGRDQLFALKDKDVGAIYLGNVRTGFDYKNQDNQLLGTMKTAGIYLKESSGIAGVIQQVDLAV